MESVIPTNEGKKRTLKYDPNTNQYFLTLPVELLPDEILSDPRGILTNDGNILFPISRRHLSGPPPEDLPPTDPDKKD